jgi:YVTN family beta-propeller protein
VVLALIGRSWLSALGPQGQRRLDDPDDFVRRELETALRRGLVIIPLLVEGAIMPTSNQLPAVLAPLATRQGLELPDRWWGQGIHSLLERLERLEQGSPAHQPPSRPQVQDSLEAEPRQSPRPDPPEPPSATAATTRTDHRDEPSPSRRSRPDGDKPAAADVATAQRAAVSALNTPPEQRNPRAAPHAPLTSTPIANATTPPPGPESPEVSPRRRVLILALVAVIFIIGTESIMYRISKDSASVRTVPVGQQPQGVALSPDGHKLWVANSTSGTISVLDTASDTVTATLSVAAGPVNIAFSPDGRNAYVTDYKSATLVILNAASGDLVGQPIPVQSGPWGVAVTPDGHRAYVTSCGASSVSVIDTATAKLLGRPIAVGTCPLGIAVSSDGGQALVANAYSNTISIIDTTTNTIAGNPIRVGTRPHSLVLSADGKRGYVANNGDLSSSGPGLGTISVLDTETDTTIGSPIPVGNGPWGLALSPDGTRLFTGDSGSGTVTTIDTTTGTVVQPVISVEKSPEGVAVSKADRKVYVANSGSATISIISY